MTGGGQKGKLKLGCHEGHDRKGFFNLTVASSDEEVVDLVYLGLEKSLRRIAIFYRFVTRTLHRVHSKKDLYKDSCSLCKLQPVEDYLEFTSLGVGTSLLPDGGEGVFPSDYDFHMAWKYFCKAATKEVIKSTTESQRESYTKGKDGILYSAGRLSDPIKLSSLNPLSESLNFVKPVALVTSKLVYALAVHLHWKYFHPGVERLVFLILQVLHVEKVRKLCKYIHKTCARCRYLLKKTIQVQVGKQNELSYTMAPIFYSCQIDIACSFNSYGLNTRVTKPAFFMIFVCMVSNAVSITVLEDLTTDSVVCAIDRHSSRYGYPKYLLPDLQSSFAKLEDLRVCFRDIQGHLHRQHKVILDFCTPLNHCEHGKVEARVKILKDLLEKSNSQGFRHSYLEWETIAQRIGSLMNSLPIARAEDIRSNTEMDIFGVICPNHFILGKNLDRTVEGSCIVLDDRSKMLELINETREFLEDVIISNVHRFIPTSLSSKSGMIPAVGDLVLFVMKDNQRERNKVWKFGKIMEIFVDGRAGKVKLCYKNSSETVFREVFRNLRDVCLIHSLDDLDFNTDQHRRALETQKMFFLDTLKC